MQFQLNITLTEEDYLAFNIFHSLESSRAKKAIRKSYIIFITVVVALAALFIFINDWTAFTARYITWLGLYAILYMLFLKKIQKHNIKKHIQNLKRNGKLPYEPVTKFEFYEDKLIEITEAKRTEQSYDTLERICLVSDRYLFLYDSSVGAHIIPIPQIKEQVSQEEFLNFLFQKCNNIEHY